MKEYLEILESLIELSEMTLKGYFKADLYHLQDFLIGRQVYVSNTQETVSIKRIYENDFDYYEVDNSLSYYNLERNLLFGDYGGVNVYPTTSLSKAEYEGLVDEIDLINDIESLFNQVVVAIQKAIAINSDELSRRIIIKNLYYCIKTCLIELPKDMENKDVTDEEHQVMEFFLTSYENLFNVLFRDYRKYLPNIALKYKSEDWGKSFKLAIDVPEYKLRKMYNRLIKCELIDIDSSFEQFNSVFSEIPPIKKLKWCGKISELKYFIVSLNEQAVLVNTGTYSKRHWASTINCFLQKSGIELKKSSLTGGRLVNPNRTNKIAIDSAILDILPQRN